MSRPTQSRAQTEANAKLLRALVKQPDNKVCVDCKKNDPRWASWNLGCFLCIRCSGIHRSMGTHISKVKSIDLDIWTPEQMDSVQKWGNRRCNLYWEAHLKAGHVPADHKIESFIRSKYESRRWAKDGPPPSDPATLDGGAAAAAPAAPAAAAAAPAATSAPARSRAPAVDLFDDPTPPPAASASTTAPAKATTTAAAPAPAAAAGAGAGIFDLDWHEPAAASATSPTSPTNSTGGAKAKNDIMSLFSAPTPAARAPVQPAAPSAFDLSTPAAPAAANPWSAPAPTAAPSSSNPLFDTHDVWSTPAPSAPAAQPPKSDAFADIWGDFK